MTAMVRLSFRNQDNAIVHTDNKNLLNKSLFLRNTKTVVCECFLHQLLPSEASALCCKIQFLQSMQGFWYEFPKELNLAVYLKLCLLINNLHKLQLKHYFWMHNNLRSNGIDNNIVEPKVLSKSQKLLCVPLETTNVNIVL
jgi:hypothetical protein